MKKCQCHYVPLSYTRQEHGMGLHARLAHYCHVRLTIGTRQVFNAPSSSFTRPSQAFVDPCNHVHALAGRPLWTVAKKLAKLNTAHITCPCVTPFYPCLALWTLWVTLQNTTREMKPSYYFLCWAFLLVTCSAKCANLGGGLNWVPLKFSGWNFHCCELLHEEGVPRCQVFCR